MIKAIFFDIDGTLLSTRDNIISTSTRSCLKQLRQNDIKTIIATGRHKIDLTKLPVKDIKFDGYLTLNGQLILDESLRVYTGTPINEQEMEIVASIFQAKRIPFMLINKDSRYMNYVDNTTKEILESQHMDIPTISEYQGENIYQAIAYVTKEKQDLLNNILDECAITSWHPAGIDIIPIDGGKAKGIEKYIESNNIKIEETMAFGDGDNDAEMLKYVGVGVAMGNASEKAKAASDYITDNIDNNGIEKALRHFGLIE